MTTESQHWVTTWTTFIKAHEKMLIIILGTALLFKAGQGIENIVIRRDSQKALEAANTVRTDTTANKQTADELAQLKAVADAKSAAIQAANKAADAELKARQAQDAISTQQQIIDRFTKLLPLPKGSITAGNGVDTITNDAAKQTVETLEQLPILQLQVTNLNAELLQDQNIIVKQDDLITGLNKQLLDEKASHSADVNLEKAKSRKSFWKGLKVGIIVGAVGTEAIRIWVGHP